MIDGISGSRNLHEPGGDRGLTVEKYRSGAPGVTLSGLAGGQFLRLPGSENGTFPLRSAEPLGLPSSVNAPFGLC
jgi:hypothetical protein